MVELEKMDWRIGNDYSCLSDVSESECKQACLHDCMCVVVTYANTFCYKKRMPLLDGRQGLDISSKAFVKVTDSSPSPSTSSTASIAKAPFSSLPYLHNSTEEGEGKVKAKAKAKAILVIGISLLICCSILVGAGLLVSWHRKKSSSIPEKNKVSKSRNLQAFRYKDIHAAIGGFREELGRGAFGIVYKGALPEGRAIAMKTLDYKLLQEGQGEKEFKTEMSIIATSHHKNLVQLYGFCDEGSHKFLVYEYMSNGSLDNVLFVERGFLNWKLRVEIGLGTARGILYLHEECATQIIHCDIKPQNILLDENYNPKISDFGLAKLMRAEQTRTFTRAQGTKGYIALEWHRNMAITMKVDVYSFGVMLLEIICCRKTLELDVPENEIFLSDWVYECWKNGSLLKLVEKQQQLEGNVIEWRHLERMVVVGLWCIQENPALRPSIRKVVQMLEGTVEIAAPPAPGSFISSL